MYWENWSDFIQMGRHGFYVWSCVLVVVVLLFVELISLAKARRQALNKLQQLNFESSAPADSTRSL